MSDVDRGHDALRRIIDVSRETVERLERFHWLLLRWNPAINLVSSGSLPDFWSRHILDSAQLLLLASPDALRWADLGSGAGFPGLVVAAIAAERNPALRVVLIESDSRKAAFLSEAARSMAIPVEIIGDRVETVPPLAADIVSARALAPLARLLDYHRIHRAEHGIGLFPKGQTVHKEVQDASRIWRFEHRLHRSLTDGEAAIVQVGGVERV